MRVINRSILVVLPKQPFLNWLHGADPTSGELTMEDVRREPAVYLLPARDLEEDLEKQLNDFARPSSKNSWMDGIELENSGRGIEASRLSGNGLSIDSMGCRLIYRKNHWIGTNTERRNLNYPGEILNFWTLRGFDDIPESALVYPGLTTVVQPMREMGRAACSKLFGDIKEFQTPLVAEYPMNLTVRESTGRARRG